jgi:hypothetical protein
MEGEAAAARAVNLARRKGETGLRPTGFGLFSSRVLLFGGVEISRPTWFDSGASQDRCDD